MSILLLLSGNIPSAVRATAFFTVYALVVYTASAFIFNKIIGKLEYIIQSRSIDKNT